MIELIHEEIQNNFPEYWNKPIDKRVYILHCSKAFMKELQKSLKNLLNAQGSINAQINSGSSHEKMRITTYFSPSLGYMKFREDLEQGYKIEKDNV